MTTYIATFSNGQTKSRTSHHPYKYAVGMVNKQTGKLANVKFTASDKQTPDWWPSARMSRQTYGLSANDVARLNRQAMAEREAWQVEIVALEQKGAFDAEER